MLQNQTNLNPVPDSQTLTAVANSSRHVVRIGPPGCSQKATPDIQLLRNNDVIETIIVRCGCGEEIRLDCVYKQTEEPRQNNHGGNQ